MSRERSDTGEFVESVSPRDVLARFDEVEGPILTTGDVTDALDCTRETARRKLNALHEDGVLGRRKTAGRVVYWRLDEPTHHAVDPDDPFWDAAPIEGEEDVDVQEIDDVLYGTVDAP